jgi:hypothetical protein
LPGHRAGHSGGLSNAAKKRCARFAAGSGRARCAGTTLYDIDADAAFDVLKWRSQESNIKLRLLAERLISQFQSLRYGEAPPPRSTFDQILLTVVQRVTDARMALPLGSICSPLFRVACSGLRRVGVTFRIFVAEVHKFRVQLRAVGSPQRR